MTDREMAELMLDGKRFRFLMSVAKVIPLLQLQVTDPRRGFRLPMITETNGACVHYNFREGVDKLKQEMDAQNDGC